MIIGQLEEKYSFVPWVEYFNHILKPHATVDSNETITVASTVYLDDLEKLMGKTDKRYESGSLFFLRQSIFMIISFQYVI